MIVRYTYYIEVLDQAPQVPLLLEERFCRRYNIVVVFERRYNKRNSPKNETSGFYSRYYIVSTMISN